MFISIGYVIIDDIVLPDGTTHMGCLGGGSVHAIMGMRVWSDQVGLVAKVGYDFPSNLENDLSKMFDLRGLIRLNNKTIRAWQLFEEDGTRNETFRTDLSESPLFYPVMKDIPAVYENLQGVHLHCRWDDVAGWVEFLRELGNPFILWEPIQSDLLAENRDNFMQILPLADCISPNLQEAQALLGMADPHDQLDEFIKHGARMAVIRAGAEGSAYADSKGNHIRVPAVKVPKVVDQTGAGNAYCGGLIVGCKLSDDPRDALCRAAVSASFALEQFGAVFPIEGIEKEAQKRFDICSVELQRLN
jgi:sugar/nucleoside kinase (ribokinase family)